MLRLAIGLTVAVGLTVIVKRTGKPLHPFAVGVAEMVAVSMVVPAFIAVNEAIFPIPLAARPMDGVLLVHVTGPEKVTGAVAIPLQRV